MSTPHKKHPADVQEAFRVVVFDYGVPEMAAKTGMPPGTLYNKANPNESSKHQPSLRDAVLVQAIAQDTRIVEAMAHTLGGLFVRLPRIEAVSDAALLEVINEIYIQSGLFHTEIKDALEDGKISKSEHDRIAVQGMKFIRSVLESVSRIEGMVDDKA